MNVQMCGDVVIPIRDLGSGQVHNSNDITNLTAGEGYSSTDLIVYVTLNNSALCSTAEGAISHGEGCRFDQFDRPIGSTVNFCPSQIRMEAGAWSHQLGAAIHSMIRLLGDLL